MTVPPTLSEVVSGLPGIAGTLGVFIPVALCIGRRNREALSARFASPSRIWIVPAILLAYCLAYMGAGGLADPGNYLFMAAYFAAPMALLYLRGRTEGKAKPLDFALVLLLWLPVELGWTLKSIALSTGRYPIAVFAAALYGMIIFTAWRRLELHCDWSIRGEDLRLVGLAFLALVALILPAALFVGFAAWNPQPMLVERPWVAAIGLPLLLAGFFFTPAFVEELMFRGFIQNLLMTRLRWARALAAASVVFGLAHLNNKVGPYGGHGDPNWVYAAFATIAGLGYGYVYHRTRSLVAASLLHALVDFTWMLLFKAP